MKFPHRAAGVVLTSVALLGLTVLAAGPALAKDKGGHHGNVIYSSLVTDPKPANLPSQAFQAQQTSEFGNQITFAGTKRTLGHVDVTMSSWGCEAGTWFANNCVTTPGSGFTEPITFNIYNALAPGSTLPGSLIASVTKTFTIPFRPSASAQCTGGQLGEWYDTKSASCYNGFANNITFNFANVVVPNSVVYGIAYNTTSYGSTPYGTSAACFTTAQGCGYDSLNVGLSQDPTNMSVGTNDNTGKVFWNTQTAASYCDHGTAGSGIFRLDSPSPTAPCWNVNTAVAPPWYVPAVQFKTGGGKG